MDIAAFGQGLIWGITLAAAIGPISLLCMHRSIEKGFWYGVVSALAVGSVDAMYGAIAGLGLTVLTDFLLSVQIWVRLLGGLILLYLGLRAMLAKPGMREVQVDARSLMGAYGSIFLLTLTNPLTIVVFLGLFAGFGIRSGDGYFAVVLVIMGIFTGSFGITGGIAGGLGLLRKKISHRLIVWLNRISGGLIIVFGLWSLFGIIFK